MKVAIYIEEGATQLVLTPENDWENSVIKALKTGEQTVGVNYGGFYFCQGGWFRESGNRDSLILTTGLKPVGKSEE